MKFKALPILCAVLISGSLSAQTLTDVINEFNSGVEKLNNQEYEVSVEHFNQVLAMSQTVGDEAQDMKTKAEEQIPLAYYRQAIVFMKRKQYDNAIPYFEKTVEYSSLYANNEDANSKSLKYLPQLYMMEGNRAWKNQSMDEANALFDKALAMDDTQYKAHQGKGYVAMDQNDTETMLNEFNLAKQGAKAANDAETADKINGDIDTYYNKFITDEMEMVDPEENDYSFVIEACEKALGANPGNPRALYHLALIKNKMVEYDAAIEYALKALQYESESVWQSAINFELGSAYQNTVDYDKACEALRKVMEEPFLTSAEKKMGSIPGCN